MSITTLNAAQLSEISVLLATETPSEAAAVADARLKLECGRASRLKAWEHILQSPDPDPPKTDHHKRAREPLSLLPRAPPAWEVMR